MKRIPSTIVVVLAAMSGCGPPPSPSGDDSKKTGPGPIAETCRVSIPPRATPLPVPTQELHSQPMRPEHPSRLITHVDWKLSSIAKELEGKVATRLATERNVGAGLAGHINYTVDRGPFTVSVEGDSLAVKTDIHAHAEVCRGSSCYASCEPTGRATALVSLRLTPDYRFAPSHVTFAFTRGCEVRVLGGMVRVDVTPTIQAQLAPSLRRVEQDVDAKLPPMRPEAERLWIELSKTRNMPLGACIVPNPRGIVQGPVSSAKPDRAVARFGLIAYPEIRSRCEGPNNQLKPSLPLPLPPLVQDPKLPPEDDLVLAFVSPLTNAASGLESAGPFDTGINSSRARIARVVTARRNNNASARIDLNLRGEACGDVAIDSPFAWSDDGKSLRLASPLFVQGEGDRVRAASSSSEDAMLRSLSALRFPPPAAPDSLEALVPSIASSMSDATINVTAKVTNVKPLDVTLREEDLAASVLVHSSVNIEQR